MSTPNVSDDLGTLDVPVLLSSFTAIIGLVATSVNLLVAFAYVTDREIRRVPVNLFFFNLSISDGMTGVNLLIYFIWIQHGGNVLSRYNIPCILWGGWSVASVLSSALLVILVSWDRLKMVTDPFKYRQFTRRRVAIQILVLWVYVLVDVIVLLFVAPVFTELAFKRDVLVGLCIISLLDSHVAYISFFQDFLIPLTILIVINGMIAVRIRLVTVARLERQRLEISSASISTSDEVNVDTPVHMNTISSTVEAETFQHVRTTERLHIPMTHSPFRRTQDSLSQNTRKEFRKMHKTINMLLLFVCVYILCWFPLYIGLITKSFFYVPPWIMHLLTLLVGLNAVINPFIYPFMSNKYRKRLTMMLHCLIR